MSHTEIVIRGAREHNLRNIDLRLPRNRLICMTGVSGSGKSSLAFDTLYAEGQRRYVESLSSYARQFLGQMPRPEVDSITGIAPSISIQQKTAGRNPRSTVGTMTEVYDYLRVLFARVGTGHCPRCWREITAQTTEQIVGHLLQIPAKTRYLVLAPLVQQQKGEYRDLFEDLLKQGYLRARVDGQVASLSDDLRLDRQMRHNIEVVVDRLSGGTTSRSRVTEAVEQALRLSGGSLIAAVPSEAGPAKNRAERDSTEGDGSSPEFVDRLFSSQYACTHCGLSFEPPSPQLFSFNSPLGMCLECNGLGMRHDFLLDLLIPDEKKSLNKGAVELLGAVTKMGRWKKHIFKGVAEAIETDLGLAEGSVLKTPWKDLPEAARELLLYGLGERHITFSWRYSGGVWKHGGTYAGIVADLLENYRTTRNPMRRKQLEKYMQFVHCGSCGGTRLNSQAQAVRVTTTSAAFAARFERTALSLSEVCALSIRDAAEFFESLALDETGQYIAVEALREIRGRLGFLLRCGLDYLTLDRTAPTLSGGESQRIRLAGQIGCGLVGVVYILDEPSIGLHPRDNVLLLESLKDLRDQGNTVIVVEHDEDTMRAADHLVDFGPGPGVRGGEVVAEGSLKHIQQEARSLTGQYLSGSLQIATPVERRKPVRTRQLRVKGATHNNLQKVDAAFPLGTFICVTGVSGSGKSSLVNDILWQVLNRDVNGGNGSPGVHRTITGLEHIDKAIDIDQSPIGRTPRSNPATYVKLFDEIRKLYTQLPESRIRGWQPGRFSFNVAGGRCEACEGHGSNRLEMDFLADIWVTCPVCRGRRFNHETLEVRYRGRSIADVLNMDIQEALEHFENHPKIARLLQTLHDVGLDYLKLGQASPTLSGGEAQRIKLARELGKRSTGKTIYLLDEPTTGLHFADVAKLLDVLHGFVEAGNTVLVIEHNLDVIRTADWVIDLGPDGGSGGGTIVAEGPPEDIAACAESFTGRALAKAFADNEALTGSTRKKKPRRKKKTAAAASTAAGNGSGATTQLAALAPEDSDATGRFPAQLVAAQHGNGDSGRGLQDRIIVRGAAQHNLQQVDLDIPRDKMNVFCGPSGSGKTSLAMDTLYAEGQRRYVESLSAYARQFLGQMPRPRVEHIHGLSPSIAIEQKSVGTTPRSTVGTVTEIYDYLRILYARLGTPYCPDCHLPVRTQTTDEVIDRVCSMPTGTRLLLLAPQEVTVGQKYDALWQKLRDQGFLRVRIDGETCRLDDIPEMDRRRRHTVEVVVDRVTIKGDENRSRVADSVEAALELGSGMLRVATVDPERPEAAWATERYSLHFACTQCGRGFEELTPHQFSFNSPLGWCEDCEGLGVGQGTSTDFLIADKRRSLREGAISAWPDPATTPQFERMLEAISSELNLPLDVPMQELSREQLRLIAGGTGDRWFTLRRTDADGPSSARPKKRTRRKKSAAADPDVEFQFQYKGLLPAMEEAARVSYAHRQKLQDLTGEVACPSCGGSRLKDVASAVRFRGKTIAKLCDLPLSDSCELLQSVRLDAREKRIAGDLLEEATSRLSFLVEVGLTYLSLSRTLPSLSGGEMQRIRLAGQIGRALTGVLYVLDEPTIGLHPRDNARLLGALHRLRDLGNTLILVEHDREVIDASDRLYDFGPGAGRLGGTVVSEGTPKQLARRKKSLTGQYLSGKKAIPIPLNRRMPGELTLQATGDVARRNALLEHIPPGGGWLQLLGARHHNLRDVDLRIPLGTLTCITGVSGSGKSSLIEQTLARALARKLHRANVTPAPHEDLVGIERINKVIVVDQQPLGSTPASNPATYTGVFDHIRQLFARLPESRVRGYTPARFSFNRAGGRCDDCEGNGQKCIEMHFLPDVWVECDTCHGRRYNQETLSVKYRGRSIADVLAMPIGEAVELFDNIPKIRGYLATLAAIGLDYLTLGQSAPTLSGGEAQRVKLASELARPGTGQTLYLLDEPTTGLHFDDIARLLDVLGSLVEAGNTVVVIEHNLDVIKTSDWLIDLGPEAGSEGGWIVAEGTPEDIVAHAGRWQAQSAEASRTAKKPAARKRKSAKKPAPSSPETTSSAQASLAAAAGLLRSHTGEMLAPVLASGTRAEREVFDPEAARAKREGDVDLSRIGKEAKMPWEADGPRWHTVDRIAHNGNPARWEGAALEHVIDLLAAQPGFASRIDLGEPDWSNRTVVEVAGPAKGDAWLLHAMTGDEWLLTLKFRVQKRTFDEATLDAALGLKPIDDIDEIQVYGRGPRVKVRNLKGPWQEVSITVHWLEEIDTPAFREFLETAVASFGRYLEQRQQDPAELMPWKKLGRKWHLLRKGFPSGKKIFWEADTLERLFDLVEELAPNHEATWTGRTVATWTPASSDDSSSGTDVRIYTKRRGGIDLVLLVEPGSIALGRIAALGHEREISQHSSGRDQIRLRFRKKTQVDHPDLREVVGEVL